MNKIISGAVVGGIMLATGAYWAGAHFGIPGNNRQTFSDGQARVMRFRENGGPAGMGSGRMMGGFATGEIISVDDKSITVKLSDGGSKIIFFSDQTPIMKSTAGARTDIVVGTNVMINGKPNQDGSLNAESIQIRPLPPAQKSVE
ncbi:MAG: DUF5666 domain-containing protein [Patescibacteria group bacterium]